VIHPWHVVPVWHCRFTAPPKATKQAPASQVTSPPPSDAKVHEPPLHRKLQLFGQEQLVPLTQKQELIGQLAWARAVSGSKTSTVNIVRQRMGPQKEPSA
jgi:hypothetical protein